MTVVQGQPVRKGLVDREVLNQDEYWFDIKGQPTPVDSLDPERVFHILLYCYTRFSLSDTEARESPLCQKLYERMIEVIEQSAMYDDLCR